MMRKVGAIPGTSVNPLSRIAPEFTTNNPLPSADEDQFVNEKPGRLGRNDVVKAPIAPPRPSFVEDDYDSDPKRREILNRNGLVALSSLSNLSWPGFDKDKLLELRRSVQAADEPKYFLAHLGETVQVESFTSKAEWLDRVLESAPHLISKTSILAATAHSTEAQLECIDTIIKQLGA